MPTAAATPADPSLEMISAMTGCAYELGLAASRIAQAAGEDTAQFLAASAEFRHCFFAVRMGIRLKLAHGTAARAAPGAVRAEGFVERERAEWPERPDWGANPGARGLTERGHTEREREREGDREPVSLPQFLKTLGVTAANAEARRGELPAAIRDTTLPRLQGLLRQANGPGRARRRKLWRGRSRAGAPPRRPGRPIAPAVVDRHPRRLAETWRGEPATRLRLSRRPCLRNPAPHRQRRGALGMRVRHPRRHASLLHLRLDPSGASH